MIGLHHRRTRPLTPGVVRGVRVFFFAVAGILTVVGAFFVVMGTIEWSNAYESEQWPSVPGTVLVSDVTSHRSTATAGSGGRSSRSRTSYSPKVEFAYSVGAVDYTSTKISYKVRTESQEAARETASKYPQGATVQVHYKPNDPSQAVLETGWNWMSVLPVAVGLFAICFCAMFMYLTLRVSRRMIAACEGARPAATLVAACALAGGLWAATPVRAATPAYAEAPPAVAASAPSAVEVIRQKHGVPGLIAGVVTTTGVEQLYAAGERRKGGAPTADASPLLAGDRMHLGSCTKAFTATLAAALVADGLLKWDSTVGDVLGSVEPAMDAGWKSVTLEQLLRHRGGAPAQANPADWAAAWNCKSAPEVCREAFVKSMLSRPPAQAPGTYAYSNQGYAIAGRMCEVAGKGPYEQQLFARVIEPLGITNAGFGAPAVANADAPSGHTEDGAPSNIDNPTSIAPAGTLHMPVEQWMKFIAFHLGATQPDALKGAATELATLHRASKTAPGEALGWMVAQRPWGGTVLTHAGSNTMWFCVAWLAPDKKFAVVAACNQGGKAATQACDDACAAMIQAHLTSQPPQ